MFVCREGRAYARPIGARCRVAPSLPDPALRFRRVRVSHWPRLCGTKCLCVGKGGPSPGRFRRQGGEAGRQRLQPLIAASLVPFSLSDFAASAKFDRVIGRLGLGQEALSEGNGSCGALWGERAGRHPLQRPSRSGPSIENHSLERPSRRWVAPTVTVAGLHAPRCLRWPLPPAVAHAFRSVHRAPGRGVRGSGCSANNTIAKPQRTPPPPGHRGRPG